MKDLNRREFVAVVATAACLCGMGEAAKLLADAPTSAPSTLDVGAKSSYTADGITDTWMKSPTLVAIIRHDGKIYAATTICTHKGGHLNKVNDTLGFVCPKHHATFDLNGNVIHGPARLPLLRYAISVDANGHLIVDKSKVFTPANWNDPASFVSVA